MLVCLKLIQTTASWSTQFLDKPVQLWTFETRHLSAVAKPPNRRVQQPGLNWGACPNVYSLKTKIKM